MLDWIEAHPGLAGWVQAVGTLLALGFAVLAPYLDRRRVEKIAAMACRIPIRSALEAMTRAEAYFDADSANTPKRQAHRAELDAAIDQLRQMPLDRLPGAASIHLHGFIEKLVALAARFEHGDGVPRAQLERATLTCREACEALVRAGRFAPALYDAKQVRALTMAFAPTP